MQGIVDAAAPVIGYGFGAVGYVVQFEPASERHSMRSLRSHSMSQDMLDQWIQSAGGKRRGDGGRPGRMYSGVRNNFFVPAPRASTLRNPSDGTATGKRISRQLTQVRNVVSDAIGIRGTAPDGRSGMLLTAASQKEILLSARSREILSRIGSHLATAYRLRASLEGRDVFSAAAAVLSARGQLLHVSENHVGEDGQRRSKSASAECEGAGARVLRARSIGRLGDHEQAVGIWRALLAGRWTVVDHRDRDGKRFLLAVANTPREQGLLSLSARERQILSRVTLAHPLKLVAYELGLSPSTVSGHVKSAVRKLGLRNVSEAVRLFGDALVSGRGSTVRSR
jgi:DNA-binding CsgD family transcriptional regulator